MTFLHLRAKSSQRAWLAVDLRRIEHNVKTIQAFLAPPSGVLAVVKSNAYGMGAIEVAKAALQGGAAWLGVGTLPEALALSESDIQAPIVLLYPCDLEEIPMIVEQSYVQVLTRLELAEAISKEAVKQKKIAKVHLNVNIGMNRLGVTPEVLEANIDRLLELPGLSIEGVLGHFSSSGDSDIQVTRDEFTLFQDFLQRLQSRGVLFSVRHVANSGATVRFPESQLDLVRVGILLYGVYPSLCVPLQASLLPAISLRTRVVNVMEIKKGDAVSYSRIWNAPGSGRIVTLGIGSEDGFPGALSSRAEVLIRGERFPVVGKICMDLCMVYVGSKQVEVGEEVVLLGEQGGDKIDVMDWVRWGNLDPHEILTGFQGKLSKKYITP